MQLMPRQVSSFLAGNAWKEYPILLFFGHAVDTMRLYSDKILHNAQVDRTDAFQYIRFYGNDLASDPQLLLHEACSSSLMQQERWIIVHGKARELDTAIKKLCLDKMQDRLGENKLIIIIEELTNKSALLKACKSCPWIAVLPCYEADQEVLGQMIDDFCINHQATLEPQGERTLIECTEKNSEQLKHLLEKLSLYGVTNQKIATSTILDCHHGDSEQPIQKCIHATFLGHTDLADRLLRNILEQKYNEISLIRNFSQHVLKLLRLKALAKETNLDDACKQYRPPIFFKHLPEIRQQCQRWSDQQLTSVAKQLTDLEIQAKSIGFHDVILLRQYILRLSKT